MEKNKILEILKEESYPEYMIDQTANKLENLSPKTRCAFEQWQLDGKNPTLTLENYTFKVLVEDFGMKPVGAFLTLDWLEREPEHAVKALSKGIK